MGVQLVAIRQNQADIAGNGNTLTKGHIAVDHIPAIAPFFRRAINDSHIVGCLFSSARVKIFHAIFGCEGINHPIKVIKQTFKKFCAGDFRFLLIRQGFVGVIGRLQVGVNRVLFLQTHSGQLLRRGEGVDQLLHVPCGKLRRIRGGGRFRLALCAAYLADIAAGCPLSGRDIAASLVMFVFAV